MTETTCIIGLTTKDGEAISKARFEKELQARFDGATVQYGKVLWMGVWEENAIVTVAGPKDEARVTKDILLALGRTLHQTAVYFRYGYVEIVDC
jgi:hypothetical protein